ncbi:MAG: thiamine pyrophosphate-dependent enzyme [Nakamurella sp.]
MGAGAITDNATVGPDRMLSLYRSMAIARALDLESVAMQRQGIIPGYAPMRGQEAAQIGSGAALVDGDFAFGTYRELGVAVARGVDLVGYIATHLAAWHGGLYNPKESGFAAINAVVAGSVLHAAGWARGEQLKGSHGVAISYFGDGASSQGEVHEAMNFAALEKSPVVFFCQNNGWAISVPTEKQVAGGSVAARAQGYGMPGERIDGNDVVEVFRVTSEAVERARRGEGPTVIEAVTYRAGPHSTSDDPGRYRSLAEENSWQKRDPIVLMRKRLQADGQLDDAADARISEEAAAVVEEVRDGIVHLAAQPGSDMFTFVFAEPTAAVQEQLEEWKEASHV